MLYLYIYISIYIEKTIFRQPKIHGKVELYTIVDPDKSEKLSITIEDHTAAKKQILDYYDGDGYAHQQNKIKSVLHVIYKYKYIYIYII